MNLGNNYVTYKVPDGRNYGVIAEYHLQRDLIRPHLNAMIDSGQTVIKLAPFIWGDMPDEPYIPNGYAIQLVGDSNGRVTFESQQWSNFISLLSDIKGAKFSKVVVGLCFSGSYHPFNWTDWNPSSAAVIWILIAAIREALINNGMPFSLDLFDEGIPSEIYPLLLRLVQYLWINYTGLFWRGQKCLDATISFVPFKDVVSQIPKVFGGNYPSVFEAHIYGETPDTGEGAAYSTACDVMSFIKTFGSKMRIGETYPDIVTFEELVRAQKDNPDVEIEDIIAWPVAAGSAPNVMINLPPITNNWTVKS